MLNQDKLRVVRIEEMVVLNALAAGCLIADNEYSEEFENRGWAVLVRNIPNFPKRHSGLIRGLQNIHDTCSPKHWPIYLQKLARKYKLTYRF